MTERRVALVLVGATAVYLVFALWRAWLFIASADPVAIVLGIAVVVIPLIGVWLLWRELRFGFGMQRMGRQLASEGGLPVDDLPKTASGRPVRDAADARFVERKAEVEAAPQDWRTWYRLSLAYDDARDRKAARQAMRTALGLFTEVL